ncbi:hypothetical protein ACFVKB_17145 [Rhodococcus sp. NPDC127530]|uniref:hypothetical protein n=1 Tax=unclassified Rhodococcus (in: high G+C Gram-positive bacteria) TaxID=192944 RepID=UPI00363A6016
MTVGIASPESPIHAAKLEFEQIIANDADATGTAHVVAVVSSRGEEQRPSRCGRWNGLRYEPARSPRFKFFSAAAITALGNPRV